MRRGPGGKYEVTIVGGEPIRAFVPFPLPPDPPLEFSSQRQLLLERATMALGRLDSVSLLLPDPDIFLYAYVRREAVLSSQIEGTQSSLQILLVAEARLHDPDAPADVSEVINYVKAMNHGLARLADLLVSVRLIREIHGELMRGVAEVATEATQTTAAIEANLKELGYGA